MPPRTAQPDQVLQFFEYEHLPLELQAISQPFFFLAHALTETLPKNPERSHCLRALLQAKDCAVRAKIARTD